MTPKSVRREVAAFLITCGLYPGYARLIITGLAGRFARLGTKDSAGPAGQTAQEPPDGRVCFEKHFDTSHSAAGQPLMYY